MVEAAVVGVVEVEAEIKKNLDKLGLGIGWRPELALYIERRKDLGFIEIIAESFDPQESIPVPLKNLLSMGVQCIPHGLTLSIGSTEKPDLKKIHRLAKLAEKSNAPLVSEHIAFVRSGGIESGHLLPIPRTREAIRVLVSNLREIRDFLPVPLALENISSFLEWPNQELTEAQFLTEILDKSNVQLLLDIENVYANSRNLKYDPFRFLDSIPLNRIAYVHVAGGIERDGIYHDTHAQDVPTGVWELLRELFKKKDVPGVMLERDDNFPAEGKLNEELNQILKIMTPGK